MEKMKVTENFISTSWVSKLKKTAREKKKKELQYLSSGLPYFWIGEELDFKLPIRRLPIKRDRKQPHSELYPQCPTSAKSLWEEGHCQVYPFHGFPHEGVRVMKLISKTIQQVNWKFFPKWKEVVEIYIIVWSLFCKNPTSVFVKGQEMSYSFLNWTTLRR